MHEKTYKNFENFAPVKVLENFKNFDTLKVLEIFENFSALEIFRDVHLCELQTIKNAKMLKIVKK